MVLVFLSQAIIILCWNTRSILDLNIKGKIGQHNYEGHYTGNGYSFFMGKDWYLSEGFGLGIALIYTRDLYFVRKDKESPLSSDYQFWGLRRLESIMTSILSLKGKSMNIYMSIYSYLLLIIILSVPNYFLSAEKAPDAAYIRLRGTAAQSKSADFPNPLWEKGNKAEGSTLGGGLLLSGAFSRSFHLALGFSIDRREEKYFTYEIEHSSIKHSLAASYYFYGDAYLGLGYSSPLWLLP